MIGGQSTSEMVQSRYLWKLLSGEQNQPAEGSASSSSSSPKHGKVKKLEEMFSQHHELAYRILQANNQTTKRNVSNLEFSFKCKNKKLMMENQSAVLIPVHKAPKIQPRKVNKSPKEVPSLVVAGIFILTMVIGFKFL